MHLQTGPRRNRKPSRALLWMLYIEVEINRRHIARATDATTVTWWGQLMFYQTGTETSGILLKQHLKIAATSRQSSPFIEA